jgi:two-component system sensor kinase FixL
MATAEAPHSPTPPPDGSPEPALDGALRSGSAGTLHGRMLQVSRLATVGEMAAGVAHELNQPLTAIANYAQACDRLLARPAANLEDIHTALREIASQAVRAGDILRRLRSLAQSQPMRRERTDINDVIEEIRDLLTADARAHRTVLRLELTPALPAVSIDTVQLQHVIVNLVRNGLEAQAESSTETPELCLRTAVSADGEVEITICDNGPGLSAPALERLFDPFFSTKPEGTGLGLAISNTVVRAHDGSLGHRPNVPRGACFYIRLPPAPAAG